MAICNAVAFRLVLFCTLFCSLESSIESDTSSDDASYAVETSEDEDYKRVMGISTATTVSKPPNAPHITTHSRMYSKEKATKSTWKQRVTTMKNTDVTLYRPNATERERINKQYEARLATNPPPKIEKPEPKGPFYEFIKNICNVTLTRFSGRKIQGFLTVLAKSLKGVGCGQILKRWVRKFRKRVKFYSNFRGKLTRPYIQMFCNYTTERRHYMDMFFNTINLIFSVANDNRFDDYIYDLKRYGASRLSRIGERTKYIFKRIIQRNLIHQEDTVLHKIESHFDLLLTEYHDLKSKGLVD